MNEKMKKNNKINTIKIKQTRHKIKKEFKNVKHTTTYKNTKYIINIINDYKGAHNKCSYDDVINADYSETRCLPYNSDIVKINNYNDIRCRYFVYVMTLVKLYENNSKYNYVFNELDAK